MQSLIEFVVIQIRTNSDNRAQVSNVLNRL